MEKYALLVAGGAGLRMGSATPKQFLLLEGKPVLWHSINAFRKAFSDVNIILVVAPAAMQTDIIRQLANEKIRIATGGETRFHSVKNGLDYVPDDAVVFVHDAVRCLLTPGLIRRCYTQTVEKGSAVPVVAATDSLRIAEESAHYVINRQQVRLVQTPQTFISTDLKKAFEQTYTDAFTDEATVMEAYGSAVFLIDGEYENIKITRPLDLMVAENILKNRS